MVKHFTLFLLMQLANVALNLTCTKFVLSYHCIGKTVESPYQVTEIKKKTLILNMRY